MLYYYVSLITGQVSDLKGHFVTQVAMGKAHTCVLIKSGEVWTFGVNNKGQCGRDTGAMSQAGKGEGFSHFSWKLYISKSPEYSWPSS